MAECPSTDCLRREHSGEAAGEVSVRGDRVLVLNLQGETEFWHPECYELGAH